MNVTLICSYIFQTSIDKIYIQELYQDLILLGLPRKIITAVKINFNEIKVVVVVQNFKEMYFALYSVGNKSKQL